MVVELPPGAYIGLINDHNLPGPDGGKGGKHLILLPDYKGKVPKGYHVGKSATYKVLLAVRALPVGGDQDKALKALHAIKVYPLSTASKPKPIAIVDTTEKAMDSTSLKWEDNIQFREVLKRIIDEEPLVEKFTPM